MSSFMFFFFFFFQYLSNFASEGERQGVRMREIQDDGDSPMRAVQIEAVQIKSDKNKEPTSTDRRLPAPFATWTPSFIILD